MPGLIVQEGRNDLSLVDLSSDDLREIESAASKIPVQGARLPDDILKMTGL